MRLSPVGSASYLGKYRFIAGITYRWEFDFKSNVANTAKTVTAFCEDAVSPYAARGSASFTSAVRVVALIWPEMFDAVALVLFEATAS